MNIGKNTEDIPEHKRELAKILLTPLKDNIL